jgi:predicted phage-related endonuclease
MSTNELTSKVRELKELKIMADELAAEITAIEDAIKAEMTARNTEEMTVDIFKIRWTTVNSNRFDTTAFKKTHADLYDQYTKQTTTRRFTVA